MYHILREWRALLKKPAVIVAIIVTALIPMLYNVIFLSSMWDPYGNVENFPVAIVNQDKSTEYNGKTISIGQSMVDSMKESKTLDYDFVDQSTAKTGLDSGDYYMVITLPENLSTQAASFLTDTPEGMNIEYQTSSGHNFVSSKISDSAMDTLKESVTSNITQTYTSALLSALSDVEDGMGQAAEGSQKLQDGTQTAVNGSQTLATNLNTLATSTVTFSEGSEKLEVGLNQYVTGVDKLATGTQTLAAGLSAYTSGVDTLASGAATLSGNSQAINDGVASLNSGNQAISALASGAATLDQGLNTLASQTSLSSEQATQIEQVIAALPRLNQAIQSLSMSTPDLTGISSYLTTISNQAQAILTASQTDQSQMIASVQQTSAYASLDASAQEEITAAMISSTSSVQESAQSIIAQVSSMQIALATLSSTTNTASAQLAGLASQADILLTGATTTLSTLYSGLNQVNTALTDQVLPGSSQLSTGLATLNTQFSSGISKLQTGVLAYTNGVDSLSTGAATLSSNSTSINTGASQLVSGTSQLNIASSQLVSGINQLTTGANKISDGASQLAAGGNSLTTGLGTLLSGNQTLTSSLLSGQEKLGTLSTTDDNANVLANPVSVKHTDNDNVHVNGVAMAPYMMSVALMVVALTTNMNFKESPSEIKIRTGRQWLANKTAFNGLIAVLSSIILFAAVHLLPFTFNHSWLTLGILMLASLVYMALVTALTTWNSKLGSLLSLILLLLQLGSSGGTYPIELSNNFFKAINPFLPMTYTVSGLRQTISMTGNVGSQSMILLLFLLIFIGLGLLSFKRKKRIKHLA